MHGRGGKERLWRNKHMESAGKENGVVDNRHHNCSKRREISLTSIPSYEGCKRKYRILGTAKQSKVKDVMKKGKEKIGK